MRNFHHILVCVIQIVLVGLLLAGCADVGENYSQQKYAEYYAIAESVSAQCLAAYNFYRDPAVQAAHGRPNITKPQIHACNNEGRAAAHDAYLRDLNSNRVAPLTPVIILNPR